MKHFLPVFFTIVFTAQQAFGLDLFKKKESSVFDFTSWSDSISKAQSSDGTLFYPVTINDEVLITGEIDIPGLTADKIFLSALNYAVDHLDTTDEHEQIGEIKPDDKSFMLRLYSRQGSNNNETTFTRLALVEACDGKIKFTVTQLDVKYREKGLIPRTVAFEKLNPAINQRHNELVDLCVQINAQYFNNIANDIPNTEPISVTYWDKILDKEVVKGMTPFEVKLILGKPVTCRDNGDRVRWIYPNNYVLLFIDGKLSRIVE